MPVRRFLCFGAKPRQRACARDFQRDRKRAREGRSQRRREKKPINRRKQKPVDRPGQRTDQSSRQNKVVDGREQSTFCRGKPTARMCGPRGQVDQREKMSQHFWWLCGDFARIQALASPQMHRMLGKYHKLFPSCTWSQPKSVFVCSLFFHSLGCVCCVLCVRKKMWNTPGRRWEKPPDDRMAMSGLGGLDSGDRLGVYCHTKALPLPACKIMIFSLLCNKLRASLSALEIFCFGGFDFSCDCLTSHLSSSARVFRIFKTASSIGAIKSR